MSQPPPAPSAPPDRLALTGERTVPGIPDERYWYERHVVSYRLAAARAADRDVLDAGCGEGYGAATIAGAGARSVVAADLDAASVVHVGRAYPALHAVQAELGALPFADASFDLVVSLQVVEHVWDVPGFLASLRRVLRPGGELVLSTPNRLTFTPESDTPVNPFHVREFAPEELRDELAESGFEVVTMLGVHHGPLLRAAGSVLGDPVPRVLGRAAPESWPWGVRRLVHRVRPSWFRVHEARLDTSLDLVAVCRVPGGRTHERAEPGGGR